MLALDGARLRRSLAMTKQDCSDRYQLPPPSSRSQSNCTHGQEMAWRRKSEPESAGSVRNIGHGPVNHPIRPLDEQFAWQPVIRIVKDPHAVVLVREN